MQISKIFGLFLCFIFLSGFSSACSTPNADSVTSSPTPVSTTTDSSSSQSSVSIPGKLTPLPEDTISLPYIYQNISAGMANPGAEILLNGEFPKTPSQLMVYEKQVLDEESAKHIANNLGFTDEPGMPTKNYEPFVFVNNGLALEVYQKGRFHLYSSRSIWKPIEPMSEAESIDIAKQWLTANNLYPENVIKITSNISGTIATAVKGSAPLDSSPTSIRVSFITTVNGYQTYTPGVVLALGAQGKVLEAYIFNPTLNEYGLSNLKSPESALNILKSYLTDSTENPPEENECLVTNRSFKKLVINHISLQYTSTDYVDYLLPIYVFEGEADPDSPNPEIFIGCIDAIDHQKP
jgi:hypothetical protein